MDRTAWKKKIKKNVCIAELVFLWFSGLVSH